MSFRKAAKSSWGIESSFRVPGFYAKIFYIPYPCLEVCQFC
jgi:hypothetical protein